MNLGTLGVWFVVMLAGALGTGARFGVNQLLRGNLGLFPAATLAVNVAGGLAMGAIAGWVQTRQEFPETLRLALATGFLGGFTTFSAFSLETLTLWRDGQGALALLNIGANVLLSIGACALGYWFGRAL